MNVYLCTGELPSQAQTAEVARFVNEQTIAADKRMGTNQAVKRRELVLRRPQDVQMQMDSIEESAGPEKGPVAASGSHGDGGGVEEQEVGGETSVVEEPTKPAPSRRKRKARRKGIPQSANPGAGVMEAAGNGELHITEAYAQGFLQIVLE